MSFSTFNCFLICWHTSEKRCDTKLLWTWGHTVESNFDFDLILTQFYIRNWVKNEPKSNRITQKESSLYDQQCIWIGPQHGRQARRPHRRTVHRGGRIRLRGDLPEGTRTGRRSGWSTGHGIGPQPVKQKPANWRTACGECHFLMMFCPLSLRQLKE